MIDRNLLPHAAKLFKRGLAFSRQDQDELAAMVRDVDAAGIHPLSSRYFERSSSRFF